MLNKNKAALFIQTGVLTAILSACGGSSSSEPDTPTTPTDSVAPVITLNGEATIEVGAGRDYTDEGATATDDVDGDVTVTTSGTVDTATVGSYTLTYSATDAAGNEAAATRTVNIVAVNAGVFIDSPVAGIGYRTETTTGLTDAQGRYDYIAGETVVFFVGDLEFPATVANGLVTPENIAAGDGTTQTNILQLLQTLDGDANAENGITVTQAAIDAFADSTVDVSSADFDTDVASTLDTIGSGLILVSEDDANEHFSSSLTSQLIGTWVFAEGANMRNVVTFFDNSHYLMFHEHADASIADGTCDDEEGCQTAGSGEYGTYSWDPSTKAFELTQISESDGSGGFSDSLSAQITLNGGSITFDFGEDGTVDFTKVTSSSNELIGSWSLGSTDNINILTFLSATEYVLVHNNNSESYDGEPQAISGEFGVYSNDSTGFNIASVSVDTDGDGGLYDMNDPVQAGDMALTIQPFGELLLTEANDEDVNFVQIGTFSTELQDESVSLGNITTRRDLGGFSAEAVQDKTWQVAVQFGDSESGTVEDGLWTIVINEGGTGTLDEDEIVDPITWYLNSAGDIVIVMEVEEGNIDFTIAKLNYTVDGNAAVLVDAHFSGTAGKDVEYSLWESVLMPASE
jgi:hypothetical protein